MRHNPIFFFYLQQCICIFFPVHRETGVQKKTSWRGETYLHLQRAKSKAPHLILEYPLPNPLFATPWMMRKKHPSRGGQMVITQDLVAVTQIFSWGRSNHVGKGKGRRRKTTHCCSAEVDGEIQVCATEGHLEVARHRVMWKERATVQLKRLTVTLYIIDGREMSTLFLQAKTAAAPIQANIFINSNCHLFRLILIFQCLISDSGGEVLQDEWYRKLQISRKQHIRVRICNIYWCFGRIRQKAKTNWRRADVSQWAGLSISAFCDIKKGCLLPPLFLKGCPCVKKRGEQKERKKDFRAFWDKRQLQLQIFVK